MCIRDRLKSGHEFKREKEARKREKAVQSWPKIASFCMPKTTCSSDKTVLDENEALIIATPSTSEIITSRPISDNSEVPVTSLSTKVETSKIDDTLLDDDDCDQRVQLCLPTQAITQDVSVVDSDVWLGENPLLNPYEYFKKHGPKDINSFFQFHPIKHGKAVEPLPFDDKVFIFILGTAKHSSAIG